MEDADCRLSPKKLDIVKKRSRIALTQKWPERNQIITRNLHGSYHENERNKKRKKILVGGHTKVIQVYRESDLHKEIYL